MSTRHAPATFVRGDTWPIGGELLNADGSIMSLVGIIAIEWALFDLDGKTVFATQLGNDIHVVAPAEGTISIIITPLQSATIPVGYYQDQLRITQPDGTVRTMWVGQLTVEYSAFETP